LPAYCHIHFVAIQCARDPLLVLLLLELLLLLLLLDLLLCLCLWRS
jgi:hypothetical protein